MTDFKEQFSLLKVGASPNDFYSKNFSDINAKGYSIEAITPANMYPNNQFDLFKNSKYIENMGQRRDNTVVIKDFYPNEVGYRAKPKNEIKTLFEPLANDTAIVDNSYMKNRTEEETVYSNSLTIKNNDFPTNTNLRPESIDGVPLTENVRVIERKQEELRGLGVNSIRLASEGITNQTGNIGEGVSINPDKVVLTKYKMKSYYDQTPEDYLKTTGFYLKPEYRSVVQPPSMDRTLVKQVIGTPKYIVGQNEYRNNQQMNPTQKEDLLENKYISNTRSIIDNTSYRNNDSVKPTQKEELVQKTFILNNRSTVDNSTYRNNNQLNPTQKEELVQQTFILNNRSLVDNPTYHNNDTAQPTIREELSNISYISNNRSRIDNPTYHNNDTAQPTIREDLSNISYISNTKSRVDNPTYHNNNSALPTIREDLSNISYISNNRSRIDNPTYHNNNSALPTIREDLSNISYISNNRSRVDNTMYHNNNSALPTIREDLSNISYISNNKSRVDNPTYHNNNSALPTIREDLSNISYISNTKSRADNTSYHNNNSALPTIREDLSNMNYISNTKSRVDNTSYHNNNSANPTIREELGNTNYISGTKSVVENTSYHNNDLTRSGFVEETLAKDYKGVSIANTPHAESRLFTKTFNPNESIQMSLDLTNRDFVGGTDQISAGTNDIGTFNSNMKRQSKNIYNMNRMRNISSSYIEEVPSIRGKELLEQRSEINSNINITLNGNPYINNMVHQSNKAIHDVIRENTIISDRLSVDRKNQ